MSGAHAAQEVPDAAPALSLVVCTRDRGAYLGACLDAVARVRAGVPWELVVVDNGSRDATPAVLRAFARTAPVRVTLVHEPRPGLARARNAGNVRGWPANKPLKSLDFRPDGGVQPD